MLHTHLRFAGRRECNPPRRPLASSDGAIEAVAGALLAHPSFPFVLRFGVRFYSEVYRPSNSPVSLAVRRRGAVGSDSVAVRALVAGLQVRGGGGSVCVRRNSCLRACCSCLLADAVRVRSQHVTVRSACCRLSIQFFTLPNRHVRCCLPSLCRSIIRSSQPPAPTARFRARDSAKTARPAPASSPPACRAPCAATRVWSESAVSCSLECFGRSQASSGSLNLGLDKGGRPPLLFAALLHPAARAQPSTTASPRWATWFPATTPRSRRRRAPTSAPARWRARSASSRPRSPTPCCAARRRRRRLCLRWTPVPLD